MPVDRRAIESTLRAIVRDAAPGVTVYFPRRRGWRAGYSWNGRHLRPTGETLESQCHEIAHLLVAPIEHRKWPEFGLGPDPYRRQNVPLRIPREEADREELAACTMQLLLVRLLGLDEGAVMTEVHVAALTIDRVRTLRNERPHALSVAWWERALACVHESSLQGTISEPSPGRSSCIACSSPQL